MSDRERRIRELLGVRGHADGCPGEDDPATVRVEAFEAERAVVERVHDPDWDNWRDRIVRREPVTVIRCIECGGQREYEGPLADVLAPAGATR